MDALNRGNLPAGLTSFIGRRHELSEARRLLAETRMLTLTGAGGVGKTRLALRVADEARRAFRDGAWWVDLAPVHDGALLPQAVAGALGIRDESPQQLVSCVIEALEGKQLLLVLDNCEQLSDAVAVLAGKLLGMAPELRILATSREVLGVEGEQVIAVPPLPVPDAGQPVSALGTFDAVTLFAERAAAAHPGFAVTADNAEAVATLCRRLDGLPLAIELAAARLRMLTVPQILDRLDDPYRLLTSGYRTSAPRHQTLRAAMDWSFALCSEEEQAMWARLSVFPGEFDLEAAEQICSGDGIAREAVFDLLAGLLDKSVVTRSPYARDARYRLLETVRQYGQGVLGRSGQDGGLRRRHRDHYLRLSQRAEAEWFGPRQVEWLARLQREQANLRAALEFCLSDRAEASRGLEIMLALWNYWVFFTGSFGEGRHWLREALALYTERTALRAGALRVDAWFALRQADIGAALPLLAECRDLAREVGDTTSAAFAVHFSGLAAYLSGDVTRGVSLLEQARAEHQANDDQEGVWMVLFHLVSAYSTRGDRGSAEACAAECLAMCEARSAYLSRSNALWMLGLARWFEGDQKQAATLIRRGLEVMHRLNDTWGIAECLEVLAWIAAADGRDDYAARLFGAAAMVWRSMGTDQPEFHPFADSHNLCETQLRKALGDQAYAAALRRGAELTVEQAVDQALDRDRPAKPPPKPQAGEAPLTAREREVAVLIARGLSNKDIAGNLVISQRTAEGHVEHILAKLGFSSRVQIATWASSHLGPAFSM